jgi:hypothetical protein
VSPLRIAFIVIALLAVALPARAAQHRERSPLSGYAVQITYRDGQSTHFLIPGREMKGGGAFTLSPQEIVRRADKDSEQVSLIKVGASPEEGAWRIKVSVVKGEFYDKGEQDVLTCLVRVGERVTVKEMEQFGVRPFQVAVVRVNQAAAIQPAVMNKTESIEVVNVEATTVPSPYRILLRNLSHKGVLALEVNTYNGDQRLLLKWSQGTWERPLIGASGTYEEEMPSAGRGQTTADGYVPEQSAGIEIGAVVFEDGTYEGGAYLAAVINAQRAGNKTQLGRVIPILQTARESADDAGVSVLTRLKEAASLLSEDADPARLKESQNQFPTLNEGERKNLVNFMRSGLHKVKATLLKEIEAFEKKGQPMSGGLTREWISETKERYERWLSAL